MAPFDEAVMTPGPAAKDHDRDAHLGMTAAVRELDHAIERYRTAFFAKHSVQLNDLLVLGALDAAGGRMLPRDLADQLRVSSGSLTMILDRLEGSALVTRVPNPADRRSVFVELTQRGLDLLTSATGGAATEVKELTAPMREIIRDLDRLTLRLTEPI